MAPRPPEGVGEARASGDGEGPGETSAPGSVPCGMLGSPADGATAAGVGVGSLGATHAAPYPTLDTPYRIHMNPLRPHPELPHVFFRSQARLESLQATRLQNGGARWMDGVPVEPGGPTPRTTHHPTNSLPADERHSVADRPVVGSLVAVEDAACICFKVGPSEERCCQCPLRAQRRLDGRNGRDGDGVVDVAPRVN